MTQCGQACSCAAVQTGLFPTRIHGATRSREHGERNTDLHAEICIPWRPGLGRPTDIPVHARRGEEEEEEGRGG